MMGYHDPMQENMFLYNIYLENRVRKDHPLRKIKEIIDFNFIYKEVEDKYGKNGNVSVPPPVILKLIFLFFFYNVRSERELMETVPERIDWLWFLGYTLESAIPDHSVLSKARARWGKEVFKDFFERIVIQCVEKGLVDGAKIFMDASFIDANASNNSVVDASSLKKYLNDGYSELEKRLQEKEGEVNTRHISTTDPDSSIVRRTGRRAVLQYKTHRAVDSLHEVITAVEVTPGAVNEAHKMAFLIDGHATNTLIKPDTVIADSKYGTIENLLECHDRGINPHVPAVQTKNKSTGSRKDIFTEEQFVYDKNTDTLICPAGKILKRRSFHANRNNIKYAAKGKDCKKCELHPQCTRDSNSRSVQRHIRKEELDKMISITKSCKAKRDLKIRQYLMERSYARSVRYGFDRARWRGLWKVSIQEYIICTIQNIETLIRYLKKPLKGIMAKHLKKKADNAVAVGYKLILHGLQMFMQAMDTIYESLDNCLYFNDDGGKIQKNNFGQQAVDIRGHISQLLEFAWLDNRMNILLFGPPGLGKTHLAIALGIKAVEKGYVVSFERMTALIKLLKTADIQRMSAFRINRILKSDLVIIDEIGYSPIEKKEANMFFNLISELYEKRSVIITSNKSFNEWAEMLGDEIMTTALLDRLLHHSKIFNLDGHSYRIQNLKKEVK